MVRDENNNNGFTGVLARKGRSRKMYHPPVNMTGELVTTDMEKVKVVSIFFASIFNNNLSSHISQDLEIQDRPWEKLSHSHHRRGLCLRPHEEPGHKLWDPT